MRVDETGVLAPPPVRPMPDHLEAVACPMRCSRATLPWRLWPKWKFSPTTTRRAPSASTSTSLDEVLGRLLARSASKRTTSVRSTPQLASSSSFWSRLVSSLGADSGRTTEAGWRSKVTTPSGSAAAASALGQPAIRARWPRWTPS